MSGIFLNVFGVAGDVGDGQELGELADDSGFVVHAVVADFLGDLVWIQFVAVFGWRGNFLRGDSVGEDGGECGEQ